MTQNRLKLSHTNVGRTMRREVDAKKSVYIVDALVADYVAEYVHDFDPPLLRGRSMKLENDASVSGRCGIRICGESHPERSHLYIVASGLNKESLGVISVMLFFP